MAVFQVQQLGQARPANTTAVSIYSPASGINAVLKTIVIANTTGSSASYRIFHDDDGTTYDQSTALFYDVTIPANTSDVIELSGGMNDSDGNFAVRTDTNNALTFTLYGSETTVA
jgi:hypothetical protein